MPRGPDKSLYRTQPARHAVCGMKSSTNRAPAAAPVSSIVRRQTVMRMIRQIRKIFTIILAMCIGGCSSIQTITSESQLHDNTKVIKVYLRDNRKITFYPGDYTITRSVDSVAIVGKGIQSIETRRGESVFNGSIGYNDIDRIEMIEPSTLSKILAPTFIVSFGLFIWLVIWLDTHPIRMG
jgi:hypothetical protein